MSHGTEVPEWALGVRRLVVLSGAGVSTDSGIADFRGVSGAWTLNPASRHRNTYQSFLADPALRAEYWRSRSIHPWHAEPNAGHAALAAVARSDIDTIIVTQNTDGLHQRAGTPADRLVELHGTIHVVICVGCGKQSPTSDVLARVTAGEQVPQCLQCGGILKTASTMFGETVPPEVFARAEEAVQRCDLLLAVGTTLVVEPVASLCASAIQAGATLVIVNRDPTPYDGVATEIIRDPLGEALPRIVAHLLAGVGSTAAQSQESPSRAGGVSQANPRPSRLLWAGARVARFRCRDAELERLVAWCAGSGLRIHAVSGPPGIGKSRLAWELADQLSTTGEWDVEFLSRDAGSVVSRGRPLLTVVEDAETRQSQITRVIKEAGSPGSTPRPVRVLLLSRTPGRWHGMEGLTEPTSDRLAPQIDPEFSHAYIVSTIVDDYRAALLSLGAPCAPVDSTLLAARVQPPATPVALQASVLAALLGEPRPSPDTLVRHELAYLRRAASKHELALSADAVAACSATVILCGAVNEDVAVASLRHIPELDDLDLRVRAARWLRRMYPPSEPGPSPYWSDALPTLVEEELVAAAATPRLLLRMLTEATEDQARRTLIVLARASVTRRRLEKYLLELLSVLPGLSPAAVDAALAGGYPAPLAAALDSLAKTTALPAELLDAVPTGTTVLGEFPVLLAESLVEAYEARAMSHPTSALRGLVQMLTELAERLTDLGQRDRALATARRAVQEAARATEQGTVTELSDLSARAAASLRRAELLSPPR